MIRCLNVPIRHAAEKAMQYKPAFDFVSDSGKAGIELFSMLLLFQDTPRRRWSPLTPIDLTPSLRLLAQIVRHLLALFAYNANPFDAVAYFTNDATRQNAPPNAALL